MISKLSERVWDEIDRTTVSLIESGDLQLGASAGDTSDFEEPEDLIALSSDIEPEGGQGVKG